VTQATALTTIPRSAVPDNKAPRGYDPRCRGSIPMQPATHRLVWAMEVIGLEPLVVTQVGGPFNRLVACLRLREVW
jgi:hypothetical protein